MGLNDNVSARTSGGARGGQRLFDKALLESLRAQVASEPVRSSRIKAEPIEAGRINAPRIKAALIEGERMKSAPGVAERSPPQSEGSLASSERLFPPQGWVRRDEACRMLGVSVQTYKRWFKEGRIGFGKKVAKPGRGWCKIYPVEEVIRLRDTMEAERGRAPEGFVTSAQAAERFGRSISSWKKWRAAGLAPKGKFIQLPEQRGQVRVFAVSDLERLQAAFEKIGKPYPDPDRAGVVRVPVMSFREKVCEALIDAADLPAIKGRRWNWVDRSDGATPAVEETRKGSGRPLKYLVLDLDPRNWSVTHANGDPLDCRRENLVVRDLREKSHASRKSKTYYGQPCSSRFKGVCYIQTRGKWRATIKDHGKNQFLGYFEDEVAAAEKYDEAARELYGELAYQNFPDGVDAWLMQEEVRVANEEHAAREEDVVIRAAA